MDESKPGSEPKSLNEVLAHFGVPGMKWGHVKSDEGVSSGPAAVTTKLRPGKKVKTSGGKGQPASADAIATAVSKQKARKSSLDSLSNKELQAMVTRMNLEQQYSKLRFSPAATTLGKQGAKAASGIILGAGKQQATKLVSDQMGKTIANMIKNASVGVG